MSSSAVKDWVLWVGGEGVTVRRCDLERATAGEELYARIIAEHGHRYDLVPVRDDQAVIVRGDARQILPS